MYGKAFSDLMNLVGLTADDLNPRSHRKDDVCHVCGKSAFNQSQWLPVSRRWVHNDCIEAYLEMINSASQPPIGSNSESMVLFRH